ncbi:MAG: hypothetical protein U0325_11410 [Polyangiales bacterium]
MFRDDQLALAAQNAELRRALDRVQAENAAMQRALAAIQRGDHPELVPTPATLYRGDLTGLPEGLRAAYRAHGLTPTAPWKIVALHVLTFGISSLVHFARMSDRLPKLSHDDPTALRAALGFLLPYYNLYWLFAYPLRLADRINLQLRLRGQPAAISRGELVAAGVLTIPFYFVFPIFWLLPAWRAQCAVNALCALDAAQDVPMEGVRIELGDAPSTAGVEAADEPAEGESSAPRAQHRR